MTVHVQRDLTVVNIELIGKFKYTDDRYDVMVEISGISQYAPNLDMEMESSVIVWERCDWCFANVFAWGSLERAVRVP